jgi:hypothetical protein
MSTAVLHVIADLDTASPCELIAHAVTAEHSREVHATNVTEDDWLTYRLILIEDDAAPLIAARHLPKRPGVVLIGHDLDDATVWARGGTIGARAVAFLPDNTTWLVTLIRAATLHARLAEMGEVST